MKRRVTWLVQVLDGLGLNLPKAVRALRGVAPYFRDLRVLRAQSGADAGLFPFGTPFPCLDDRFAASGTAKGHYFHQDFLVARRVYAHNPMLHVDVGSRVDGLVAHIASFREIVVIDIRPLSSKLHNVQFIQADLMKPLPDSLHECCDSLSCLHALEHFGLGRYGDPVDWNGYLSGLESLHRILKPGGKLYLSVPIGPQRIEFNAHRIFSLAYLMECFRDRYRIEMFSFVDDDGQLHEDVQLTANEVAREFGCHYGCGIFEMTKL